MLDVGPRNGIYLHHEKSIIRSGQIFTITTDKSAFISEPKTGNFIRCHCGHPAVIFVIIPGYLFSSHEKSSLMNTSTGQRVIYMACILNRVIIKPRKKTSKLCRVTDFLACFLKHPRIPYWPCDFYVLIGR